MQTPTGSSKGMLDKFDKHMNFFINKAQIIICGDIITDSLSKIYHK